MQRTQRRRHLSRRFSLSLVLIFTGLMFGVGAPTPALASSTRGSSGSFTFGGEVSGTLKVPGLQEPGNLPGCSISPSQGGTDVITWDNVKLKQVGGTKTIPLVDLQLQVSTFGRAYSMVLKSNGSALGAVFLSTNAPYQWASVSGTIATAAGGKSGSVTGALSAGTAHAGTVSIKGSWAGCRKLQ